MKILYTDNKEKFVAYYKHTSTKKKAPCVIFHHGLMSDMNGTKATHIEKYCQKKGYNFIRFDNFGHGDASGEFIDETISNWLKGLNMVIEQLTDEPILLVGSSMGGWISMLSAMDETKNIIGVIGLAPAPDFTEELIWNQITSEEKNLIERKGKVDINGKGQNCERTYPINYQLILDAKQHLLLSRKEINISCPVCLIHGMQDGDVPYTMSIRAAEKIISDKVIVKLINGANHYLSREQDLQVICNSIDEMLANQ